MLFTVIIIIIFLFFLQVLKKVFKSLEFKLKYPADTLVWQKKNIKCFFIYNSPDLGWWGGFITGLQAVLVEDPWSITYFG